jgi:hypothetical protein
MKNRQFKRALLSLSMEIHICQNTITNMQFKYFKKLANLFKKKKTWQRTGIFLSFSKPLSYAHRSYCPAQHVELSLTTN